MGTRSSLRQFYLILFMLSSVFSARAQDTTLSSDELFRQARQAAFDKKDYQTALILSKKALEKSPDYTDIQIFLGRLYTWTDQPDSARTVFTTILQRQPDSEDASLAYGSLEYWNDQSTKALSIVDSGLKYHPKSSILLLLKAKVLNDLRRFTEANKAVSQTLQIDRKNTEARALANRIKDNSAANSIGIGYDFVHFDKQFTDPWHLASFDYGRQTKLGSVTARVNYARRFAENGLQYELEAYPRISETFYAYVGGGYSADSGIFPKYRGGFSLFANLPASFEAEAGLRLLHFSDNTTVYTFSAGKYFKNYWFNVRTYLTPSGQDVSQSYSLTTRYYYGGADDYISLSAGTGISPDDNGESILLSGNTLHSTNIGLGFRRSIKNRDVIILGSSWQNQEYRQSTWGNQVSVSIGYQRKF